MVQKSVTALKNPKQAVKQAWEGSKQGAEKLGDKIKHPEKLISKAETVKKVVEGVSTVARSTSLLVDNIYAVKHSELQAKIRHLQNDSWLLDMILEYYQKQSKQMHHIVADRINPSLLQQIEYYLSNFEHPTLQRSLGELEALQHCEWRQKTLQIVLKLPFVWRRGLQDLQQVSQSSWKISSVDEPINWRLLTFVATLKPANGQPLIPNIRNLIAVHSAKGGVGKSSIAVNLALALAAEGGRVGLFDADIYGPSIPTMLGMLGQKPHIQQQHMQPIEAHGIVMNSIGYLLTDHQAPLWRGPMASRAVEQLLRETLWPELDYLVIDMPPGTGDIPLTLAQKLPITAVIGITTPQQVAISDTQRGFHLWRHLNIPVLGIVENMSHYYCPHCNQQEMIFGSGGGQKLAEGYQIPLLGQLPLQPLVQQHLDQGIPTVIAQPQSPLADWFYHLADQVAALLYWQGEPVGDMINIRMCD